MRNTNKGVDTMICPCKGCTDREIGCHSKCSKYINWNKIISKKRDIVQKEKQKIQVTRSYVRQRMEEDRRWHR